ncbi:MAG: hypothetical protein ACI9MF_001160 [Gammaproteobacteria bacterium]
MNTETPGNENVVALKQSKTEWARFRVTAEGGDQDILDFSELNLSGGDFADRDLSGADFFSSNLENANLKMCDLSGAEMASSNLSSASLYKSNLKGTIFQEAKLTQTDLSDSDCTGADFRGADLTGVNFSGANLTGANFKYANLENAVMRGANLTSIDCRYCNLSGVDLTLSKFGGYRTMRDCFYGVRGIDSCFGNAVFIRDVKDQDYIDTLRVSIEAKPDGLVRRLELRLFRAWGLIDHGRSLLKVGFYAVIISTLYGLIYTADMNLAWGMMDYSNSAKTWFTPFYYSLVTYTTLGYGDVTANSLIGEMLVISEVVVGYFTLGLLLSILANTIARRS